MIDYAEALTVIDVNSGSFVGRGKQARLEDTITRDEPRGRRGGRQPAAPARHRRDHRHRLHRHGAGAQPRRGAQDAAQGARRGPHQDLHRRDLQARPGRDDAPERHRGRARDHDPGLPDVRRRRRRARPRRRSRSSSSAACASCAARAPRKIEAFLIRMHPHVSSQFTGNQARVLHALEAETGRHFHFTGSEGLPHDHFDIVLEGTDDEVARAGDAVPRGRRGARHHRRAAHVRRSTTPWPRSTATSSRSPTAGRTWARSASCASRRPGARRPPRCWSRTSPPSANGRRSPRPSRPPRPRPSRRRRRSKDGEAGAQEAGAHDAARSPRPRPRRRPTRSPRRTDDTAASDGDDVESKPRRRGRRGGRRRSAAKAEATSD